MDEQQRPIGWSFVSELPHEPDIQVIEPLAVRPVESHQQQVPVTAAERSARKVGEIEDKRKKREEVVLFARASLGLGVIGVINVTFGFGELMASICTVLLVGGAPYSGIWGGFPFSTIDGSLALFIATKRTRLNQCWTKISLIFGLFTMMILTADLILLRLNISAWSIASFYDDRVRWGPDGPIEAGRLFIISVLFVSTFCQLLIVLRLKSHFDARLIDLNRCLPR